MPPREGPHSRQRSALLLFLPVPIPPYSTQLLSGSSTLYSASKTMPSACKICLSPWNLALGIVFASPVNPWVRAVWHRVGRGSEHNDKNYRFSLRCGVVESVRTSCPRFLDHLVFELVRAAGQRDTRTNHPELVKSHCPAYQ